jgi:hypothetical protein
MGWDSSRPVPWRRLTKEWAVYAVIMAIVFGLILRSTTALGSAIGLVLSLPMYLAFGAVLAKFGYRRPSFAGRSRGATSTTSSSRSSSAIADANRARPAPTRRTSTGVSQHPRRTSKNRRR